MNIFYNKNSLNDTLLIAICNKSVDVVENRGKFTCLFSKNELVAINIFNVSKDIDLKSGYLFPNPTLINYVKSITNIDIQQYINPTLVIAEIIECEDIPNTHLHKCIVNIGSESIQIICGAKNARVGLFTVCALNNTFLPNGTYISNGELMGYKSFGMLCSDKELGLSDISHGIVELKATKSDIGKPFMKVYSNE